MTNSENPRNSSEPMTRAPGARRLGVEEGTEDDGADGIRSSRRLTATPATPPSPSRPAERAPDPGGGRSIHRPKPTATPDSAPRTRTSRPVS